MLQVDLSMAESDIAEYEWKEENLTAEELRNRGFNDDQIAENLRFDREAANLRREWLIPAAIINPNAKITLHEIG